MSNEQVCQVSTLLTLLSGVLKPQTGAPGSGASLAADHYERLFLFCLTWSLGGLLDARDRPRFDAHLRALTDQAPEPVSGAGRRAIGKQAIARSASFKWVVPGGDCQGTRTYAIGEFHH